MIKELEFLLHRTGGIDVAIGITMKGGALNYSVFEGNVANGWEKAPRNRRLGMQKSKAFLSELEQAHLADLLSLGGMIGENSEGEDEYHIRCVCDDRELFASGTRYDNLYLVAVESLMSSMDRTFGTCLIPNDVIDSIEINFVNNDIDVDLSRFMADVQMQSLLHLQSLSVERRTSMIHFFGRHPSWCSDFELSIYNDGSVRQILDLFERLVKEDGFPKDKSLSDDDAVVGFRLVFHGEAEKSFRVPCRKEFFYKKHLGDMMLFVSSCISNALFSGGILDRGLFA